MSVMEKGLKYCPLNPISRNEIVKLAASIDCLRIDNVIKGECATVINRFIRNKVARQSTSNPEHKIIKGINHKLKDLLIIKSDKSQAAVIMKKDTYLNKTYSLLIDEKCEELEVDPTNTFNKKVKEAIFNCNVLFKPEERRKIR